ncbi:DUF935 domain-containing protein [Chitinibacter sp. ZOR0017]|uniref:DUF935 domain-containing protein n=1 Tax=Chitinibacter sp. ZOR0017 TaxID=1339254 RepID=UPI000646B107|nr:DUF935 domain-containing protein [Chitinibacter sp. ZOR0017]
MPKILDQYGNPIEQAVLREAQSAKLTHTPREFAQHPAKGLTPPRLAQILEMAEMGNLAAQADLFCDIEEKDAHVFAEMSKRKRALLTLDWRVEPPRNATPAEKKQAEQVQEWLLDIADFEDVLLDCLDGIGHGFSALEIDWQRLGSTWHPQSLTHRPQRWFQTLLHDGNALRLRDGSLEGAELWPFGWVIHKHKAKSGYLTRAGLHRVLAWPYLFKNYSVRDLAEFLEIYGLPLRLGKYPSGATEAEKSTLLQAVASIGHNAAGIIPEGMVIEFVEAAKGSSDPFQAMMDWCEKSQSKAILGGTLTSQADGKTSTNALGSVHNEVRHDLMVSDSRQLASTLSRDLIYPLLALNAGDIDPRRLPQFVFDTRQVGDMKLYADSLPKLVGLGLRVKTDWVHDKLAIPVAQKDDEVLVAPRPEMALPPELRPKPGVADAKYRAVLTNAQGEVVYPDQHAIDTAELPDLDAAMQALLAPLVRQIQSGDSPEAVKAALSSAWPELDDAQLQSMLTRALFVADVWGRINGAA